LRRKGKLKELVLMGQEVGLNIEDHFISIEYESPMIALQKTEDAD
jgi:hypothetical protein